MEEQDGVTGVEAEAVAEAIDTNVEFEASVEKPKRKGRAASKKPSTVFSIAVPKHGKRPDGTLPVVVPYNDAEGVRHVANVVLSVNEAGELTFTT